MSSIYYTVCFLFSFSVYCCFSPDSTQSLVRGLVLLNCAGGMNNKAVVEDWRIKLLFPLLWLVDFLLKQRGVASFIFERVKQRYFLLALILIEAPFRGVSFDNGVLKLLSWG